MVEQVGPGLGRVDAQPLQQDGAVRRDMYGSARLRCETRLLQYLVDETLAIMQGYAVLNTPCCPFHVGGSKTNRDFMPLLAESQSG